MLNEVDRKHNLCYGEAVALLQELNVEEKMLQFVKRSIYRDNPPTEGNSQYYRQALIPALNLLLTELDKRFNETNKPSIDALRLIPELMISSHYKNVDWISLICNLARNSQMICHAEML